MTALPPPGRADILELLAGMGDRTADEVGERIDSMELAWLAHQVEQRYGVELDDDQLFAIRTVDDAVTVLGEAVRAHA
jgi:acyl carrier protein